MKLKDLELTTPRFSGSIPEHYDRVLGPMFFEPYAIEVSQRIDPSSVNTVLEIGSGTGRVTAHLRNVISSATKLIGSDISEDMLAVAKEKLKGLDIDWRIIDAQDLPFDDDSIDVIVGCFCYMFVPDKHKAFAEAHRVLRPGGMFIFSTWDKLELNGASYTYRKIVKKLFEDSLPESYNLPFSMNDQNAIKGMLKETGFSKIKVERVDKDSISQTAGEAANGLARGGSIYNEIMMHDPSLVEEIIKELEKELSEKFGTSPMIAPMTAVVCQAWK
jgi:ubiquinone/menaquinone biosynthesis C-methylase UbiE